MIKPIPYLSDRMDRIDSSRIRRAFDLAAKLENPISLSIGQPHYPTPRPIIESMQSALQDGKTSYTQTQGIIPLRERLVRKYAEVNGFETHVDDIFISSGIASLLQLLFMTLVDPGDTILLTDPAFLIYRSLANFFNANIVTIPEDFTAEDIESLHLNDLKMILFSSPSNPSGYIMSSHQLTMLGNLADRYGAMMVSDEIYELFDYDHTFVSAASVYPRAITLTGFSKTYSMTGLRLAALVGPQPLIQALNTIQQYTVVCAPAPVQWAGIAALDLDMSAYVDDYRRKRDRIVEGLNGFLEFKKPGGAIYLFARVHENDEAFIERAVHEERLILVPGNIFTTSGDRIRISFGVDDETLERGIAALKRMHGQA